MSDVRKIALGTMAALWMGVLGQGCSMADKAAAAPEAPMDQATRAEAMPAGAATAAPLALEPTSADGAKEIPDAPKQAPQEQAPNQKPEPGTFDPSRKQPILIYRADFSLSVYEVSKSIDAVEGLAKGYGGYLSRRDDTTITVRVPAEKFQDLVAAIEKVGDVLHRNVVSEDVTAEYRDLEVQMANLTALRLRYEKLLEKAQKVEDALAIERELGRITGDIERVKGRLKLLSDLARYSTITVNFAPHSTQKLQQGPFVLPLPWLNQTGLKRLLSL